MPGILTPAALTVARRYTGKPASGVESVWVEAAN